MGREKADEGGKGGWSTMPPGEGRRCVERYDDRNEVDRFRSYAHDLRRGTEGGASLLSNPVFSATRQNAWLLNIRRQQYTATATCVHVDSRSPHTAKSVGDRDAHGTRRLINYVQTLWGLETRFERRKYPRIRI